MAVPALATEESIRDLIERVTAEGQLTRNSGTNSLKVVISILNKTYDMMAKQLEGLVEASTVNQFLKEEEQIEASRKIETSKEDVPSFKEAADKAGGFGILFTLMTGIITGFIRGIGDSFRLLTALTDKIFKRRITAFSKKLSTNLSALFRPITRFFDTVGDAFSKAKIGGDKLGRSFKAFALGFSVIREQIRNFGKIFDPIRAVFKEAGVVGKIFTFIATAIKPFFNFFASLGRFLGGPITLAIFALIDGIFGAFKGFKETAGSIPEKILGAVSGIGAGIISGFVGGLADLTKMLVGFIAGLFGFEEFKEKLASFSFREMLFDALMFPFRALMSLFDDKEGNMFADLAQSLNDGIVSIFLSITGFIKEKFKGVGRAIAGFFGFGDDAENTGPVAGVQFDRVSLDMDAAASAAAIDASRQQVEDTRRQNTQTGGVNANVNAPQDNSVKSTTTVNVTKNMNSDPVNPEGTLQGAYAF